MPDEMTAKRLREIAGTLAAYDYAKQAKELRAHADELEKREKAVVVASKAPMTWEELCDLEEKHPPWSRRPNAVQRDKEWEDRLSYMATEKYEKRITALELALEWALDLLDMYDSRLALIDSPSEVYDPIHVIAKAKAREALAQQPPQAVGEVIK